jgi:hypothetical protein
MPVTKETMPEAQMEKQINIFVDSQCRDPLSLISGNAEAKKASMRGAGSDEALYRSETLVIPPFLLTCRPIHETGDANVVEFRRHWASRWTYYCVHRHFERFTPRNSEHSAAI